MKESWHVCYSASFKVKTPDSFIFSLAAEKIHFPDESKLNLQSACDEMETTDEDGMEICIEDQDVSSLQTGEPVRCVASSYTEYPAEHVGCLNAAPPVSEESSEYEGLNHDEPTREQITKDAIVHAIFHALDCIDKMGGSLNSFADLLTMARVLYCKGAQLDPDDQDVLKEWPKGWSDAKKVLSDVGYTDAKEYFICLNDAHPCHWDILESRMLNVGTVVKTEQFLTIFWVLKQR